MREPEPGIEVTRAQVQLANDQQKLMVAENDRRRAGLNLLRAMGLKLDAAIELTDKLVLRPADIGTLEEPRRQPASSARS